VVELAQRPDPPGISNEEFGGVSGGAPESRETPVAKWLVLLVFPSL